MTKIKADTRREDYTASALQTVFPYSFPILESAELDVYVDGVMQAEGTDYTVSGADTEDGGNVTFTVGRTAGEAIIIVGNRAYERLTDFDTAQQVLLAEELNDELSAITIAQQQLALAISRAIRAPTLDVNPNFELPTIATRKGKYLYFADPSGDPEPAELLSAGTTLSQSVIAGYLTPPQPEELAAGLVVVHEHYKVGHIKRYGALVDGVTDDTAAVDPLLRAGGFDITIPSGHLILNSAISATDGILVGSNTRIFIEPGVTVTVPTGGMIADRGFIRFRDEDGLTIIGNHSVWEFETKPVADEQRHIFDIRGGKNVYIENTVAKDSGGDGYYVGAGITNDYAENVYLVNVEADNCRRQGVSIVSGKNIHVNGRFININGTSPEAGIDIEPDSNADILEGIYLNDVYTEGNNGAGIKIDLHNMPGAIDRTVSIFIRNPVDKQSAVALLVSALDVGANKVDGLIRITGAIGLENDNSMFTAKNYDALGPRIEVHSPQAIRPNEVGSASVSLGAAYLVYAEAADTGATNIGNIHFYDPRIVDDRAVPKVTNYFYVNDQRTVGSDDCHNVNIFGKIEGQGQSNPQAMLDFFSTGIVEDLGELLTFDATAGFNLEAANSTRYITNAGAPGTVEIELDPNDNMPIDGMAITFTVETAQILRLDPKSTSRVQPGGNADGDYIQSNNIGDRLTIRRKSATQWNILEEVGTWTRQT